MIYGLHKQSPDYPLKGQLLVLALVVPIMYANLIFYTFLYNDFKLLSQCMSL
jgi:hypothetical protein